MPGHDFELDPRLEAIASLVRPGEPMVDVGTDHGRLPGALVLRRWVPSAIASDVAAGPLEGARRRLGAAGLLGQVETRQADGLDGLQPDEAATAVIAGMGGARIRRILQAGPLVGLRRLVVSPQTDVPVVRRTLVALGFRPLADRVLRVAGRFYWVIAAERGPCELDEQTSYVGSVAGDRSGSDFAGWIDHELARIAQAGAGLAAAETQDDGERLRLSAQRSALLWARASR